MDHFDAAQLPAPPLRQQVKSILADALEHECGLARTTFVAQSCPEGSPLRAEVEALLAQEENSWCNEEFLTELRRILPPLDYCNAMINELIATGRAHAAEAVEPAPIK